MPGDLTSPTGLAGLGRAWACAGSGKGIAGLAVRFVRMGVKGSDRPPVLTDETNRCGVARHRLALRRVGAGVLAAQRGDGPFALTTRIRTLCR